MLGQLTDRVRVDGTELQFEVRGTGEPVVLVHGGLVADAFAPLLNSATLSSRYQLISYHRRAYGGSERAAGPAHVERQAEDTLALLRHLGIEQAHVAGYSVGGLISLQLAAAAPVAVRSLALLEPMIPGVPLDDAAQAYFMSAVGGAMALYGAGDRAGAMDAFARGAFGPDYRVSLDRALPGGFERFAADADAMFQIDLAALQQWQIAAIDWARIAQPVLSIYHEDERWSGFRVTHEFLQLSLPQLETFVLPTDTHLLQMVEPEPVADRLARFFADHPIS